jgi:hypothetical protein
MNAAQRRMTGYVLAGMAVLLIFVFLGRYALRETPTEPPTTEPEPPKPEPQQTTRSIFRSDEPPMETPVSQPDAALTTNAATLYQQAFELYDVLSKDKKGILGDMRTNVDASVEAELCKKIRPICDLMHEAGAATNCDWGLPVPITNSVGTLLPLLSSSRALARMAVWSAAHCHKSAPSQEVSDLLATSRLGHNLPPLLIGYLTDLAIQGLIQGFTAKHAGTLARSDDPRLLQLFEDGHFDERLYRAIENEGNYAPENLSAMSDEQRRQLTQNYPQTQTMSLDQIGEHLRQAREWEAQYAAALQLPESKYQQWLTDVREAEKTNPFLESFMFTLQRTVELAHRATVTSAMVVAGLAVTREGPAALQSHPDPANGQPFGYTESPDGFELQSSYEITNGVPLKMEFK